MSIKTLIARGILRLIDDSRSRQTAQIEVLADETLDDIERPQDYGFTSVPFPGAETVVIFRAGNRSDGIIIKADDRRYRLKGLKKGEVAIYSDEGQSIQLLRGNKMAITTDELTIHASHTQVNGDITITGDTDIKGDATINGISFVHHIHPGDSGGNTGTPR